MRKFKKISAIVLAVAMVLSLMSVSVFADSTQEVYYILDATPVTDGQFTLNVYVADNATGVIQNPDGFYLTTTQLELVYDNTVLSIADNTKRANAYYNSVTVKDNGLIKMASLNAAGTEFKGTATPAAVFTCTVIDSTKSSTVITPQNALAIDENAENVPSNLVHFEPLTVTLGSTPVVPDPTPTTPAAPTAAPTVAPTAAPTATPEPQAIKPSTSSAVVGKDFSVTITRTDASEEATVKVILTPAVEGAAPTVKEVTFPAGETKVKVTVTADEMEKVAAKGESFNISVLYNDEEVYTIDKKMSTASSSSGNSGLTTGSTGVTTPAPATAAPGTEPTTAPGTEPTVAPSTVVFEDVPATYWGYDYIMDLYNNGIVNGVTATQFMPESNVTRAEFTKMAVGIFGLTATSTVSPFSDVSDSDWFAPYVIAASEAGIVQGITDTEFGPDENITREQMATIIGRQYGTTSTEAVSFTDAASIESYALPYVAALVEAGYLTGDENGAFNPKNNATRAESAALLDRVYASVKVVPEATAAPEVSAEPEATATATPEAK